LKNLAHHSKKDLKGQSLSKFLLWDFPRKVTVSPRPLHPNLQKVTKDKIVGSDKPQKRMSSFELSNLVGSHLRRPPLGEGMQLGYFRYYRKSASVHSFFLKFLPSHPMKNALYEFIHSLSNLRQRHPLSVL